MCNLLFSNIVTLIEKIRIMKSVHNAYPSQVSFKDIKNWSLYQILKSRNTQIIVPWDMV